MGKKGKKDRRKQQAAAAAASSADKPSFSALDIARQTRQGQELLRGEAGKRERMEMAAQRAKERKENPTENQKLIDQMSFSNSLDKQQKLIRSLFTNLGIDWESYEADKHGDGDQSPFTNDESSDLNEVFYDKLFDFCQCSGVAEMAGFYDKPKMDFEKMDILARMTGLGSIHSEELRTKLNQVHADVVDKEKDVTHYSRLGYYCERPHLEQAEELIRTLGKKPLLSSPGTASSAPPPPGPDSEERRLLLEWRDTTFHLTPMMIAIFSHMHITVEPQPPDAFKSIIRLLLKYGANPFAQDVMGRTVVHYATDPQFCTSPVRTAQGLEMAQMCIDASRHYNTKIHKSIMLQGLSNVQLNGSNGYCSGYDTDTSRLVVYLSNNDKDEEGRRTYRTKPIAVKPENVCVKESSSAVTDTDEGSPPIKSGSSITPLVDIETRYGTTALLKVALGGTRGDIASFLIKNSACIDAGQSSKEEENDGKLSSRTRMTPRSLATSSMHQMLVLMHSDEEGRPVDGIIRREIARLDKKDRKIQGDGPDLKICAACKERKKHPHQCTQCYGVVYCNRDCQRNHWKVHKEECRNSQPTPLGPPSAEELDPDIVSESIRLAEGILVDDAASMGGYNSPAAVAVGEVFWLKVSAYADSFLLCYDETNQCRFVIYRGSETFQSTFDLIRPNYVKPCERPNGLESACEDRVCEWRHFKAKFTETGTCLIYPKSECIKKSF